MLTNQKILLFTIMILILLSTSFVFAQYKNNHHDFSYDCISDQELAFWGIDLNISKEKSKSIYPSNTDEEDYFFWGIPKNLTKNKIYK